MSQQQQLLHFSPTTVLSNPAASYGTALSLPSYHGPDFLPYVQTQKNKKSIFCKYRLRVAAAISFHVIQLYRGLLTFARQKWIPLQLRGKVNECELNTGRVFRISQPYSTRGVGLLLCLIKATNGCREQIINALHTVDCCNNDTHVCLSPRQQFAVHFFTTTLAQGM